MRQLYVLPYSPWSERPRWTLLHHRMPFEEKEHTPLVGELLLRRKARRWRGEVTVPLLLENEGSVMGSLAISEHVDRAGNGATLFPEAHRASIRELDLVVEPLFHAQRARLHLGVMESDEAAREALPAALRSAPFAVTTARIGAKFIARKYHASFEDLATRIRDGFEKIRRAVSGREYVHDGFSYADVICATALQFMRPVGNEYIPLGEATRRRWEQPELARDFVDLLEWRDAIYRKHRPRA